MADERSKAAKTMTVRLLAADGEAVRLVRMPRGTTFLLNLVDGRYYDAIGPSNPNTFIVRADKKRDLLGVVCPTCDARIGWACGRSHVDPIHLARITLALKSVETQS